MKNKMLLNHIKNEKNNINLPAFLPYGKNRGVPHFAFRLIPPLCGGTKGAPYHLPVA